MSTEQTKQQMQDTADRAAHSASADKAKGHTKQVIGTIKEKVGKFVGDDELQAKGAVQHAEGKKDQLKGEIKEKIEDVKDKVKAGVEVAKEKIAEVRSKS